MSWLRNQGLRSSSQGEIGLFNHIQGIDLPVHLKNRRTAAIRTLRPLQEQPQPRVEEVTVATPREEPRSRVTWTVGSPERVESESKKKNPEEGFCGFLEACSLCKKKLKKEEDIYMYGHLGAFCSPDCRDDKIALDEFYKETDKEQAEMATVAKKMIKSSSKQRLYFK